MISSYDALGIYDRLCIIRLKMREMTDLSLMTKEGILRTDAVSNMSSNCVGSLYTLLESSTECLDGILEDYKNLLDKDKTEE